MYNMTVNGNNKKNHFLWGWGVVRKIQRELIFEPQQTSRTSMSYAFASCQFFLMPLPLLVKQGQQEQNCQLSVI
jgi:hypothetical protein